MTSTSRIASICLVAMLSAVPAGAQDSRAAELAAQQAEKSKHLEPNTPTTQFFGRAFQPGRVETARAEPGVPPRPC